MRGATPRTQAKVGSTVPTPGDLVTQAQCEAMADVALGTGRLVGGTVRGVMIVAVPDTVKVEAVANGYELPDAHTLRRSDGRSVSFFRLPAGGSR